MTTVSKVWTEKYADMSHGKTRYWEAGEGYPTILIHGAGWLSGCESWALAMGPLSQNLRVMAIDCLNWGLGDIFNQEMSFAYLVDHVREFMDVLGIDKANFVGHSMGGWIVTLLSYESPERVNKVVNVAGGGTATRPLQNMVDFKVPTPEAIRENMARRYPEGTVDPEEMAETFIKKIDLPGARRGIRQGDEAHDRPDDPPSLQHPAPNAPHQGADAGHLGQQRPDQRPRDGRGHCRQHPRLGTGDP